MTMRMGFEMAQAQVQRQRTVWKSRWIASCLPLAEAALRKHRNVLEAVDRVEGHGDYASVMDAMVAAFLPELRGAMVAFYEEKGPPLREHPAAEVAQLDARLAGFIAAVAPLTEDEQVAAILAVRVG